MALQGDVLEMILAHVPQVNLVSASAVSESWNDAVCSSLRYRNRPRPWLILHKQSTRPPYAASTHAYDPRSRIWVKLNLSSPRIDYTNHLNSSNSSFLYMLTTSCLCFSSDALNLDWRILDPPLVWRADPIVARVNDYIIVAGGGCFFASDPLAVEIYDLRSGARFNCNSMPMRIRESLASVSLSVAVAQGKLIVASKETGLTHWFDPEARVWSGPFHLDPGVPVTVSRYLIGYTNQGLFLLGVLAGDTDRVKVWRVDLNDFHCGHEIGEMPVECVEKLRSDNCGYSCLNTTATGCMIYVYNYTCDVEELVACELLSDDRCVWWSVRHVVARGEMTQTRLVYTCSDVGIEELKRVMDNGDVPLK